MAIVKSKLLFHSMQLLRPSKLRHLVWSHHRYVDCPFWVIFGLSSSHSSSTSIPGSQDDNQSSSTPKRAKVNIASGPGLADFVKKDLNLQSSEMCLKNEEYVPYIDSASVSGMQRRVYFETYGCQMNVNDTEIAWAILKDHNYIKASNIEESDVILVMTCAIREGAEAKIWKRLKYLKYLKTKRQQHKKKPPMKIGVLGCMAERLKTKILEQEQMVDLVCGPDAYRNLPHMLAITDSGQAAVNVQLSLEETYADVIPVRLNQTSTSAFVSIMRGCDNMCSYCIVPFTRGRERSRPIASILDEIKLLSEQGVKEVTLLGQNVNSYRDMSEITHVVHNSTTQLSKGFQTIYKPKLGGQRFSDLLDKVSQIDPDMRIRFTSPHPKDFPDEVLHLIKDRNNICNQLHLPAQSGSSSILEAMRRGYTREAYDELVHHIREILPDVSLSSDFITGFCGETQEDHQKSLDLIRSVQYHFVFCFPYSMRQKTRAYHRLSDDVALEAKKARHNEMVQLFREISRKLLTSQIGQTQLILVEGESKRSSDDLYGRNESNTKVIIPKVSVPTYNFASSSTKIQPGDYVVTKITDASSQVLKGSPLYHSSLKSYASEITHITTRSELDICTSLQ